jgi:hypothetical protein
MEQLAEVFARAHRKNIQRYRRLLRTHLTALERSYVERRLAEEKAALLSLTFHPDLASDEDPPEPAIGFSARHRCPPHRTAPEERGRASIRTRSATASSCVDNPRSDRAGSSEVGLVTTAHAGGGQLTRSRVR